MIGPTECCENCRFWAVYKAAEGAAMFGECRRYPLELVKHAGHWCGEHQPAKPAATVPPAQPKPTEADEDYRARLLVSIAGTVNEGPAKVAIGAELDKIGAYYSMARR